MESLSNGMEVAWYRYMFRKDETNPDPESNASVNKEEPALDEVILKDKHTWSFWISVVEQIWPAWRKQWLLSKRMIKSYMGAPWK